MCGAVKRDFKFVNSYLFTVFRKRIRRKTANNRIGNNLEKTVITDKNV